MILSHQSLSLFSYFFSDLTGSAVSCTTKIKCVRMFFFSNFLSVYCRVIFFCSALALLNPAGSCADEDKTTLLKQLTDQTHRESIVYPAACFFQGIDELEKGEVQKSLGFMEIAETHFEGAMTVFQHAFELSYPENATLAALCLKFQIQICLVLDTEDAAMRGLMLIKSLLNSYRENLFLALAQPDEIFFFQGILAGKISLRDSSSAASFFLTSEKAFQHLLDSYPKSEYYAQTLQALGKLYYLHAKWDQAQSLFQSVLDKQTSSLLKAESLFWLGQISDVLGEKSSKRQYYLRALYETYPESPFAAEAYFRVYDYSAYLSGDSAALEHLQRFSMRYPRSPYVLNALYLIGLNALKGKKNGTETMQKAEETFREIESAFDRLYLQGYIPEDLLGYYLPIRYRGILEAASLELSAYQAHCNESTLCEPPVLRAEKSLQKILQDFEDPVHSLVRFLSPKELANSLFSPLYQEAALLLVRVWVSTHRSEKAKDLCAKIIQAYQNANITKNRDLAKIFFEYAKIAAAARDHEMAIEYFKKAETAGKEELLMVDESLDLWIHMALSYQALGALEEAMSTLSHAVNYHAISPYRLKAMYHRVMIYEAQGRKELARNQLETMAKNQGEWAEKARTKLREDYVVK